MIFYTRGEKVIFRQIEQQNFINCISIKMYHFNFEHFSYLNLSQCQYERMKYFPLKKHVSWFISDRNLVHDSSAELSTIKANLTELLQASNNKLVSASGERNLLNANLTEMTKELNRLQSLSKQSECVSVWVLHSCQDTHSLMAQRTCLYDTVTSYSVCLQMQMMPEKKHAGLQHFPSAAYFIPTSSCCSLTVSYYKVDPHFYIWKTFTSL